MALTSAALRRGRVGQTGLIVGLQLLNTLQLLVLVVVAFLLVLGRAVRETLRSRPQPFPAA